MPDLPVRHINATKATVTSAPRIGMEIRVHVCNNSPTLHHAGVVKRVAALLLGLALLGLVLFFAGYNYTLGGSLDVGDALQEGSSLQEVITE